MYKSYPLVARFVGIYGIVDQFDFFVNVEKDLVFTIWILEFRFAQFICNWGGIWNLEFEIWDLEFGILEFTNLAYYAKL